MQSLIDFVNLLWGFLSIAALVLSVVFVVALFVPAVRRTPFVSFFRNRGLFVAFIVSLLAMLGSLTYSDIIGYEPCKLCWFQRIAMYPQVVLMGVAIFRKDEWMKIYGVILSAIGGAIALYHYVGQLGYTALPCSAIGYSVSCSQKFVLEFGYITIPMMAFSAFALILTALLLSLKKD